MTKKLTNSEFLERLENKGIKWKPIDKYENSKTKISFLCDRHGRFMARPNDILNGYGCPYCGGTKKMSESEFINKATHVHNGFFRYADCGFKNVSSYVDIICPIHGAFRQKANNHLNGQGCPKCKHKKITHSITKLKQINSSTKIISDIEFNERYYNRFGRIYDLSNTKYINAKTIFYPKCSIHGEFPITPNHLMSGRGCPKCGKNYHYAIDELINKFKQIHGDKYAYDKVIDSKTHEQIDILCHKHGYFRQTISNHLNGQGCPKCKSSAMQDEIRNLLADANIQFEEEKRFDWLGRKSLDFYIQKCNIAIECQGIQHFESISYFGGNEFFEKRLRLDKEKLDECRSHDITILYYANYDYDFPYEVITNKNKLLSLIKEKR